MGMYAKVCRHEVKMSGLLAKVVIELASKAPSQFRGVELVKHDNQMLLSGGGVRLTRSEVSEVWAKMRQYLLDGWANKQNAFQKAPRYGSEEPLLNVQDVLSYYADVDTFSTLAVWLAWSKETELIWA